MRMMIVDDNRQLCESMQTGIDWQAMGLDDVRVAFNGRQATDLFLTFLPDIVITDVCMPDISGLQFLETIKKIKPDVKVVMISGYAEFEYAAQAMRHGASRYELKPLSMERLLTDIAALLEEIRSAREQERQFQTHRQAYRDKLLKEILSGDVSDARRVADFLHGELGIDENNRLTVMYAAVDEPHARQADKPVVLEQVLRTLLRGDKALFFLMRDGWTYYVGACASPSRSAQMNSLLKLKAFLEQLNAALAEAGFSLSAGVSGAHAAAHIAVACGEARAAYADGKMARRGAFSARVAGDEEKQALSRVLLERAGALFAKEDGEEDGVSARIDEIFAQLDARQIYDRALCLSVTAAILNQIRMKYADLNDESMAAAMEYQKLEKLNTVAECAQWCKRFYRERSAAWTREHDNAFSATVRFVRKYVQTRFAQPITVETAAREADKSPNYLSHLFKQECGVSFTRYLKEVRVEEAKRLILQSNMMIYEIAEAVGYNSYIHFTQVFKEIEGIPPTQLRKAAHKEEPSKK